MRWRSKDSPKSARGEATSTGSPAPRADSSRFSPNLVGSFLLGFYLARREQGVSARWSLQLLGIGMLGSVTTFSAFSLDGLHLVQDQRALTAVLYVFASLVADLGLALVGERAGRSLR